ncbi:MAG: hypothetical protein ACE5KL_06810 [Alphaproteobacteria bacterium]
MRHGLAIWVLIAALAVAGPVPAQAPEPGAGDRERVEELARERFEQLLRALEALIQSIPQYEAPEITEDGDIIIRRKRESPEPPEPLPSPDAEST